MSQTVNISIVSVVVAIIAVGGLWTYSSLDKADINTVDTNEQESPVVANTPEDTQVPDPDEAPVQQDIDASAFTFVSCSDSLYSDSPEQYEAWEQKFSELYPNLRVYDAGAYCVLNNDYQLISFSYFSTDGTVNNAGQVVALFDGNDQLLKTTENFRCNTMGDLGYPVFMSLENSVVTMMCSSGDAGHYLRETYELHLDTFAHKLTATESSLVQ